MSAAHELRRSVVVAIGAAMLVACSSDDDVTGSGPEGDAPNGGAPSDGSAADSSRVADASVDAAPVTEFSGEATYYAADGTGACGFKATPNDLMVAALNGAQYKKSWCGQCALVTGPKGTTVKVRIVDLCPGCKQGDLDLSKQAFAALSTIRAGRIPIRWHIVPC